MRAGTARRQTRARSAEDKETRAGEILAAALDLFRDSSFAELTMAQVAARAGVAKGTVFLYFPTKEALGLALVERLLAGWLDEIDQALDRTRAPASPEGVARLFGRSVEGREGLVQLLAILGSVLEHNVAAERAAGFKRFLLSRMAGTGRRLEHVLPFLHPGDGTGVILLLNALAIGLHQMAGHAPVVKRILEDPEFRVFRIDFPQALAGALHAHLEGLRALRGSPSHP